MVECAFRNSPRITISLTAWVDACQPFFRNSVAKKDQAFSILNGVERGSPKITSILFLKS